MNSKHRMPAHRCAAPGCDKTVPGEVLMCYPHWRRVPGWLKREVTTTWRVFSADPFDQDARDAYNRAREAAIAALSAVPPGDCQGEGSGAPQHAVPSRRSRA